MGNLYYIYIYNIYSLYGCIFDLYTADQYNSVLPSCKIFKGTMNEPYPDSMQRCQMLLKFFYKANMT